MKRKMKRITAFICASVMVLSSCLVDGVFISRANEGSNPVIKFKNPGIGANVGDTVDLSKYDVEFEDGVVTSADDLIWQGQGRIYKVPFTSPAIPATAGTTLDLSEYQVQFEENGEYLTVDKWENGNETITNFVPAKGVSQLTATSGEKEKLIYVVAKDAADEEYVLYYNDLSSAKASGNETDGFVSKNDFVNASDETLATPNYLTLIRTKAANTHYTLGSGIMSINRYSSTASEYSSMSAHMMLPTWLNAFGDYKVRVSGYVTDCFDDYFVGIDLRAQHDQNVGLGVGPSTIANKTGYLYNNYLAYIGKMTTDKTAVVGTNYVYDVDNKMKNGDYKNTQNAENIVMTDKDAKFTLQASIQGNTLTVSAEQGTNKTEAAVSSAMSEYTKGRIGIFAYHAITYIDEIQVDLVVDELECEVLNSAAITSFVPSEAGVSELQVKNTKTDAVKTIYIIAKDAEDTEYVLYENNFDTDADAEELVVWGSETTATTKAISDGQLKLQVNDNVFYKIDDDRLQDFGNYRIEMTATTDTVSNENSNITDKIGLFARGTDGEAYSVKLKYKYFDSDGVALSKDTQISWGKYAYTYAHIGEEYVHSMRVQEDLVEYNISNANGKTGTALYDVREKDLQTGAVGLAFQHTENTTYKVSVNKLRVLFCPDEVAPNAPIRAKYTRTTAISGMADGTITVNLSTTGSAAKDVVCYWGDASGNKLEGYTNFGKVLVPEGEMTVTVDLGSNIMVPEGAEKLLVYTENFMGMSSACVAIDLPESMSSLALGTELQSFQVVSDTHIEEEDDYASENFKKFLSKVVENDSNSMGIFFGGDLVDSGAEDEYKHFNQLLASYEGLPRIYSIIGNHEFWFGDASSESWQANMELFYQYTLPEEELEEYSKPYYAREIEGMKFIFLNSDSKESAKPTDAQLSTEQVSFLRTELESTVAGKPVFVFLHQPLANTVVGSTSNGVDKSAEVQAILANYPQAILFTSHSHVDLDQPGTMIEANESGCNMFNTAAVSYLMNKHYTSANVTVDGAQGYYVEVYADKVLVRGKNLITNEWMPSAQFVVFMNKPEDEVLFEDSYDFTTYESIGYLDDAFVAHQYQKVTDRTSSYAVADDKLLTDYFQLDDGLRAKAVLENGYTVATYSQADVKNFEAEVTISNIGDSATGLLFGGQPGVLPITQDRNADNDTGVAIYMTADGAMYVYGAVKASSATSATKATNALIYPSAEDMQAPENTTHVNDASYVYVPGMASASDSYTLHVKVSNGRLSVYEKDNHKQMLTVDLKDAYKGGYVSLFATDNDCGTFEAFKLKELKAWDYDMSVAYGGNYPAYLDDAFDVYYYTRSNALYASAHDGNGGKPFEPSAVPSGTFNERNFTSFTATTSSYKGDTSVGALKPAFVTGANSTAIGVGGRGGIAALTYTKQALNEFYAEYDFFPGTETTTNITGPVKNGLIIGGVAGTVPLSRNDDGTNDSANDIGVALYMTQDGTLYVYGAIDATNTPNASGLTVKINQDTKNVNGVSHVVFTGMTDGEVPADQGTITASSKHYTMCVTVKDGWIVVYEKNHPDRVARIPLASTYQSGSVSLFSNSKTYGGFGGFRVQRLENYDFTSLTLNDADQYFYSYRFNKDTAVAGTNGKPSAQWSLSDGKLAPTSSSANTILTLTDKEMTNFEASVSFVFLRDKSSGILIAPEGEIVTYNGGYKANPGGLLATINGSSKQLQIYGAVDAANASWTGTIDSLFSTTNGYIRTGSTGLTYGQEYVLHMKVEDGVVSAWIDGLEGKLSANLTGAYVGGNVSVYATAGAQATGINVKPLEDAKAIARTELPMKITPLSGGAQLILSSGTGETKLQGTLKYDADKFTVKSIEYVDELTGKLNNVAGIVPTANAGSISLDDMLVIAEGKTLAIEFEGNSRDYSSIYIEEPYVTTAGGRDVARVDSNTDVAFDYRADQMLDARDLVRGKKNEAEGKNASTKSLRRILVGEPISIISEDVTFELPASGDKVVSLGNAGSTTIYTDCTITVPNSTSRIYCDLLGPVTLDGVTIDVLNKNASNSDFRMYANGYELVVNENVTFTEGSFVKNLYGGSRKEVVSSTSLVLYAGTYMGVYGGGCQKNVTGSTNVIVGGTVNSEMNPWDHNESNRIYAGGFNAVVGGDTHVTITGDAKANLVYGGGYDGSSADAATVGGTCYIDIKGGKVMGYYGGNREGLDTAVKHTVIQMTAGETEQIFGGSDRQSMALEGSTTSITISGGTVIRRIYGGCYNEATRDGLTLNWESEYYVNGSTEVVLGANAVYSTSATSDFSDTAICASSRGKDNKAEEQATLKYETQALYNKLSARTTILNPTSAQQLVLGLPKGYDEYWIAGVEQ